MCGVCALTDNNKQECGCMCVCITGVCITGVCGCSGSEVGLVKQTKKKSESEGLRDRRDSVVILMLAAPS